MNVNREKNNPSQSIIETFSSYRENKYRFYLCLNGDVFQFNEIAREEIYSWSECYYNNILFIFF